MDFKLVYAVAMDNDVTLTRLTPDMAAQLVYALGGQTKVARMVGTSPSTVHQWMVRGMPASRVNHLRLIASVYKYEWPLRSLDAD